MRGEEDLGIEVPMMRNDELRRKEMSAEVRVAGMVRSAARLG